jgi:polyferredoxin
MHKLKKIRLAVSIVFFVMFTWEFLAFVLPNEYFTHTINALQFFPSYLEFTVTFLAGGGSGFILILILTLIFGRAYCSFLCPLGAVQDVVISLKSQITGPKSRQNKYTKSLSWLHYSITAIVVLLLTAGVADILGMLDPFANFGRMASVLFKPVAVYLNNAAAYLLNTFDIYTVRPKQMHGTSASLLIFTSGFFVMLVVMAVFKGRFYCNSLCPVGGILGLASRKSFYKIQIEGSKCTACGLCEKKCKANCIDYKNKKVDFSRCVACYNCLGVCKSGAVAYAKDKKHTKGFDKDRRTAIKMLGTAGAGAVLSLLPEKLRANGDQGVAPVKRMVQVIPPGAGNYKKFNSKCISCHLCITSCPSRVIAAQFLEGGTEGFLQPYLDYGGAYCNFKCNTCSHVCPTGALLPLTTDEKKLVKIGEAKFVRENCLVHTKKQECLVCNEYCPTKACSLVPYERGLKIPKVIEKLCIGCGACENRCPAAPKKAIYVEGLMIHKKAEKPSDKSKRWTGGKDFPF